MEDNIKQRHYIEMTDEQIENFRKVLSLTMGSYALIMPEEEIITIRDNLQSNISHINN